jgi:glutathione S-transferase
VLSVLNEHLKPRTYLVGERLTLADISVAADLLLAYQHVSLDLKHLFYKQTFFIRFWTLISAKHLLM